GENGEITDRVSAASSLDDRRDRLWGHPWKGAQDGKRCTLEDDSIGVRTEERVQAEHILEAAHESKLLNGGQLAVPRRRAPCATIPVAFSSGWKRNIVVV